MQRIRTWETVSRDFFLSPSEIERFDKSEIWENAKYILKKAANEPNFKIRSDLHLVWDYLITCLIFDNASRLGAINNMKLAEFVQAI